MSTAKSRALLVLSAVCTGHAHTELRTRVAPAAAYRATAPLAAPRMALGAAGGGWARRGGSLSAHVRSSLATLRRIGGRLRAPGAPSRGPASGGSSHLGGSGAGRDGGPTAQLAATAGGGFASRAAARERRPGKLRVLFLISDTGGGHRASAQALEAALHELYPGAFDCSILDIWTRHSRWPYNTCVQGYRCLAKRPLAWRLLWTYSVFPPTREATSLLVRAAGIVPRFERALADASPDLVISMHPLTQDLPLSALERLGGGRRPCPFVTVVTDLGSAHPHWFDRRVDTCFVPSEALRRAARRRGLRNSQVRLRGLPIRPTFWQSPTGKVETRHALGLKPDYDTVLVVGGGDGVGQLGAIVDALASAAALRARTPTQIVVVCGRNRALCAELQLRPWPAGVRVVVHGFVSQMSDFMAAADVLVTKAGPGTIAEASARGLPLVLSSFLPGQEAGNVQFVTRGGFGAYRHRPSAIASTVMSWLDSPQQLADMSSNALAASRPLATYEIAHDIGTMLVGRESQLMPRAAASS